MCRISSTSGDNSYSPHSRQTHLSGRQNPESNATGEENHPYTCSLVPFSVNELEQREEKQNPTAGHPVSLQYDLFIPFTSTTHPTIRSFTMDMKLGVIPLLNTTQFNPSSLPTPLTPPHTTSHSFSAPSSPIFSLSLPARTYTSTLPISDSKTTPIRIPQLPQIQKNASPILSMLLLRRS